MPKMRAGAIALGTELSQLGSHEVKKVYKLQTADLSLKKEKMTTELGVSLAFRRLFYSTRGHTELWRFGGKRVFLESQRLSFAGFKEQRRFD